jgi:hypothetical protein
MASKFLTNIDLVQNQILNGRFESVGTDPTEGNFDGRLIFNTTEGVVKVYDNDYEPASGETKWRKMLTKVTSTTTALVTSEANGVVSLSIDDVVSNVASGLMTGADKKKLDDASSADSLSTLVIRDGSGRFQVANPSDDLDAANKGYVDSARAGLDVKQSVKVATTEPIVLSTGLEEGDEIDGYTLVAGDRVLVKDQDTASENGIYIVEETGAPTRASDADSSGEVSPGMFTFVEQGTLNADSGWVLITDGDISLGTTGLEFSLFSVAGNILAGAGLSKTGDTLDVNVDGTSIEISDDDLRIASGAAGDALSWDDGVLSVEVTTDGGLEVESDALQIKLDDAVSGLTTTSDGLALDVSVAGDGLTFTAGVLSRDTIDLTDDVTGTLPIGNGGTNATTASAARESLAETSPTGANTSTPVLARIVNKVIGNGTDTSYTITHNFGTRAVMVQVFDSSTYDTVITDVVRTTIDSVTVSFSVAPASGAFTAVITG